MITFECWYQASGEPLLHKWNSAGLALSLLPSQLVIPINYIFNKINKGPTHIFLLSEKPCLDYTQMSGVSSGCSCTVVIVTTKRPTTCAIQWLSNQTGDVQTVLKTISNIKSKEKSKREKNLIISLCYRYRYF